MLGLKWNIYTIPLPQNQGSFQNIGENSVRAREREQTKEKLSFGHNSADAQMTNTVAISASTDPMKVQARLYPSMEREG